MPRLEEFSEFIASISDNNELNEYLLEIIAHMDTEIKLKTIKIKELERFLIEREHELKKFYNKK